MEASAQTPNEEDNFHPAFNLIWTIPATNAANSLLKPKLFHYRRWCAFSLEMPLSITKPFFDSKMAVDLAYNQKPMGTDFRLPVPAIFIHPF